MANGVSFVPSYGSLGVNDQLVSVFTGRGTSMVPPAVGPAYQGYGQRPPATIPSGVTPNAGVNSVANTAATDTPFSLKLSPLPLLLIGLVVAVLGLRYIHWRK